MRKKNIFITKIPQPHHLVMEIFASLMLILVSSAIAWGILAAGNFGYSTFYEKMHIGNFIDQFAALNEFGKQDFAQSSKEQRISIFNQIAQKIHQKNSGLEKITFEDTAGQNLPFLTQSEVDHLEDVGKLVRGFLILSSFCFVGLIILKILMNKMRWKLNIWRGTGSLLIVFGIILGGSLAIWGFKGVFYTLHHWIFPPNHAWFFYYQESLMTTLMKAPDLFAAIGIAWGLMSVIILLVMVWIWNAIKAPLKNFSN